MSPLEDLIWSRISREGPITVAEYMELALGHPEHGYYMKGDPFGIEGDFITAPEISQVFGELLGLWSAVTWQQLGEPPGIALIECGPGRGTLMRDLLRAAQFVPGFASAIQIHLVETSPAMRAKQKVTLSDASPVWHDTVDTVPPGPTILIANEFLDALPIRQLVRTEDAWTERCVDLEENELVFRTGEIVPDDEIPLSDINEAAEDGSIFETCPAAHAFADSVQKRLADEPGAALFIDYGHTRSAYGDTLQAVRGHAFDNVLSRPGEADLTAHVDFDALARRFRSHGARIMGPISQGKFLTDLGIGPRTARLAQGATAEAAKTINAATERLVAPGQMGELFKVMVATHGESPTLAGFETEAETIC